MTQSAEIPRAITIAGSDSGAGAGVQADLKTFAAFGVFGTTVITALTAQNTREVTGVFEVDPDFVVQQFETVMSDIGADAGKTGMMAGAAIIEAVCRALERRPIEKLVVDPVLAATSGRSLLESEALVAFRHSLLPKAYLLTPNLPELEILSEQTIATDADVRRAAEELVRQGASAVLVKGGHDADPQRCDDLLFDGRNFDVIGGERIAGGEVHGTGCALAAAIAAMLARGADLPEAVREAKAYVTRGIKESIVVGRGARVLHHPPAGSVRAFV